MLGEPWYNSAMPQIREKKKKAPKEKGQVQPKSKIVSAYSEEGARRNAETRKRDMILRIVAVTAFLVTVILAVTLYFVLGAR